MKHFLLISFLLWLVATAHSTLPPTAAEIQQAVREAATDYVGDFVGQWVWRRVLYSGALDGPGTRMVRMRSFLRNMVWLRATVSEAGSCSTVIAADVI